MSEAQRYEIRLKYCILYRGVFPEGIERAIIHLIELYNLRYKGRAVTIDEYDHQSHFMASISHWLFEHFPFNSSDRKLNLYKLLARRQWTDAAKLLPEGMKMLIERAPLFGNARQMSMWRNDLYEFTDVPDEILLLMKKNLTEVDFAGLSWMEKLCLAFIFQLEPISSISDKAKLYYAQTSHKTFLDQMAAKILTDESIFEDIKQYYCRPQQLWFPVHLQLVLYDCILDEILLIRYSEYLAKLSTKERILAFDYLLRCKNAGEKVILFIVNSIPLESQQERQEISDKLVSINVRNPFE